jgi:hypothetical protein
LPGETWVVFALRDLPSVGWSSRAKNGLPSPTDNQAAFRAFPLDPVLATWLNSSFSSPARTAEIRVSITTGSLSLDGTTMPA